MIKHPLPNRFHKYFWDTNVSTMNPSKSSLFTIQRLLDKGDDETVRWVRKTFSTPKIKEALIKLRGFNPKVANFWALFLNIPKDKIVCLQKHYLRQRKTHWPY